ncbi:hypothetical protein NONO_c59900 [Nocardia nova SH22a]|uniref:Uncharacterized protein n=1 Tax=Nocardia nova SH22a TaxID=1415166 RepID=W5TU83_9NOCA|nr:hypothetical protein [Nocardia nova]AHH20766.1 hypothetical protein NONO_c59900 [Nocardia nova SH22a]
MSDTEIDLSGYVDVATRIAEVREKMYPNGSFQPARIDRPYSIETIGDQAYVVVVAAFYRTADDIMPGIGMAWEQVPGRTAFTRGSEIQNAETSAWGRALVAALAADTKKGVASADEVRNRAINAAKELDPADLARAELLGLLNRRSIEPAAAMEWFAQNYPEAGDIRNSADNVALRAAITHFSGGDAA